MNNNTNTNREIIEKGVKEVYSTRLGHNINIEVYSYSDDPQQKLYYKGDGENNEGLFDIFNAVAAEYGAHFNASEAPTIIADQKGQITYVTKPIGLFAEGYTDWEDGEATASSLDTFAKKNNPIRTAKRRAMLSLIIRFLGIPNGLSEEEPASPEQLAAQVMNELLTEGKKAQETEVAAKTETPEVVEEAPVEETPVEEKKTTKKGTSRKKKEETPKGTPEVVEEATQAEETASEANPEESQIEETPAEVEAAAPVEKAPIPTVEDIPDELGLDPEEEIASITDPVEEAEEIAEVEEVEVIEDEILDEETPVAAESDADFMNRVINIGPAKGKTVAEVLADPALKGFLAVIPSLQPSTEEQKLDIEALLKGMAA